MGQSCDKTSTLDQALAYIHDGCTLMVGGFGGVGTPPTLVQGILDYGIKDLTIIANDTGFPDIGIGKLITAKRVRKVIVSHIGSNPNAGTQMMDFELEVEFSPQGTLIERIRAGGMGLGGILTDVGIGTVVEESKQKMTLHGRTYLVEPALTADVSIIHAAKADPIGNLVYDKSGRNFNPWVAMAGTYTIAEVDEIVPLGSLDPECIVTPSVFVDMIIPSRGVNWQWAWETR